MVTLHFGVVGGEQPDEEIVEIDEFIVYAQKKPEKIQEVPISLSAYATDDIEDWAIRTSRDVISQTPNLQYNKTGFTSSHPLIFSRGVGINDFNVNSSGAVGVYSDDIYLNSPSGQVIQLFDIERIEVLRGPQGTLYGRNTTGGAINFISKKPTGEKEGYAQVTYGSYDQIGIEAAFEVPVVKDKSALRVSFVSNNRDGYT